METLKKLQNWYLSNCNGEWEHDFGMSIGTLDNPGWTMEINLIGTHNENIPFKGITIERSEEDWIQCKVENNIFKAACGPLNLEETLGIFLKWTNNFEKRKVGTEK